MSEMPVVDMAAVVDDPRGCARGEDRNDSIRAKRSLLDSELVALVEL